MTIPRADRIDAQRLLSMIMLPFAAALAMASAAAVGGGAVERIAEAGGMAPFVLGFVQFCYLAVGMAHLSGVIVEKINDRLVTGARGNETQSEPQGLTLSWHDFPNHIDGAAIACGVTVLCLLVGDFLR